MAARRKFPWLVLLVALLSLAGAAGGFAGVRLLGSPCPLGVALPEVPKLYELLTRDELGEASVIEGRIPDVLLEQLAQQPDGSPPLNFGINVDLADFHIRHPYGVSSSSPGPDQAMETGVLLAAEVQFDQPLRKFRYTMPFRQDDESVTTYMSRTRYELEQEGAKFYPDTQPLAAEGYRFEHYEYDMEIEGGAVVSHFVFVGPFGKKRVLAMDFMTTPELHERASPYVWKIMRSFNAGWHLREGAQQFDAAYIAQNGLDEN